MLAMRVDAGSHVAVARSRDELVAAVERGAAGVVYVFEDFNARECDEVMAAAGDGAIIDEFPAGVVTPGLVDAHGHLMGLGEALSLVALVLMLR